jgi:hypothetical protein
MAGSIRADVDGLAEKRLERRALPVGGPQLELGIAVRAHVEKIVLPPIVKLDFGDDLRVAAFESFRQAKQRGQCSHHLPIAAL